MPAWRPRAPRRRLAAALSSNTLPPTTRSGLARTHTAHNPPRTEKELAEQIGCHRSTVGSHWRRIAQTCGPRPRLEDLLDWNLLLRALELRQERNDWVHIALELRIHERNLHRLSQRLTDRTPEQLAALPPHKRWHLFDRSSCRIRSGIQKHTGFRVPAETPD